MDTLGEGPEEGAGPGGELGNGEAPEGGGWGLQIKKLAYVQVLVEKSKLHDHGEKKSASTPFATALTAYS